MSEGIIMKLWSLIAERFKGHEDFYGIRIHSKWEYGWHFTIYLEDREMDLILQREDKKVRVRIDLELIHGEVEKMLLLQKYGQRFNEAGTEEEKRKIHEEMIREENVIFNDFKQGIFDKYFDRDVAYLAKKYFWAREVARRMSEKYCLEVKFEAEKPEAKFGVGAECHYSTFTGIFDSSNMREEQILSGVRRAIDAVLEAKEMLENEEMMNEFLISRGIKPSFAVKAASEKPKRKTVGIVGKLRDMLLEKFKEDQHIWEIELRPPCREKMLDITIRREPQGVGVTVYEDGKIRVGAGKVPTSDEIWDYLYYEKYRRRLKKAKTEEEEEKISEEVSKEKKKIIEDFKQERFEEYLRSKGKIAYYAKQHMWAYEIARRISSKYGLDVKFEVDVDSFFTSIFDPTEMREEQVIEETMKRIDAMVEADEMLWNYDMMNEFLISRGIEPWKSRRRKRAS